MSADDFLMEELLKEADSGVETNPTTWNYLCRAVRRWDAGDEDGCTKDIEQALLLAETDGERKQVADRLRSIKKRKPGTGVWNNFYRSPVK